MRGRKIRNFLCKVLVVFLLCNYQTASAYDGMVSGVWTTFKVGATVIVGLTAFGVFTGVRSYMLARSLRNPDFLQIHGGSVAINHYSHISRYNVEKEYLSVRDYLKIAAKQEVALMLRLRDSAGNSSIATLVNLSGNTVEVRHPEEDGGGVAEVPLAQISGVALYEPDSHGRRVVITKDKLIPLSPEDAAELSRFSEYHALVLTSFSDGLQLLRIFAANNVNETVDNDGWLLDLDRGIDVIAHSEDVTYLQPE